MFLGWLPFPTMAEAEIGIEYIDALTSLFNLRIKRLWWHETLGCQASADGWPAFVCGNGFCSFLTMIVAPGWFASQSRCATSLAKFIPSGTDEVTKWYMQSGCASAYR
jgi:hypothetical protein